jgi:hypothetical protein
MKSEVMLKYPHSASLFQFCRKVLDHKFGGIRVIDQDVGQILGFDPADCSHWKKGKKNIRSIQAMKSIADHLGVDEKLIVDVASGEMNDLEAFYEYAGYGGHGIAKDLIETAKKDFYAKNANTWTREKDGEFRDFFNLNETIIDQIVLKAHKRIEFNEAPLYLPEIAAVYPNLTLKPNDEIKEPVAAKNQENSTIIEFPADEKMRPYIRYQIAKTMGPFFFDMENLETPSELGEYACHVRDIQSNIFAAKLLTPANLIRKELAGVNTQKDLVTQLADIFWVSKIFMNRRLKVILERNPQI